MTDTPHESNPDSIPTSAVQGRLGWANRSDTVKELRRVGIEPLEEKGPYGELLWPHGQVEHYLDHRYGHGTRTDLGHIPPLGAEQRAHNKVEARRAARARERTRRPHPSYLAVLRYLVSHDQARVRATWVAETPDLQHHGTVAPRTLSLMRRYGWVETWRDDDAGVLAVITDDGRAVLTRAEEQENDTP